MHEVSLAESIVHSCEQQALEQGFQSVAAIRLSIGPLSCVEPEALKFALSVVTKETLLCNAEFLIEQPEGKLACRKCQSEYTSTDRFMPCPQCGSVGGKIIDGNQALLISIDVIDDITHNTQAG